MSIFLTSKRLQRYGLAIFLLLLLFAPYASSFQSPSDLAWMNENMRHALDTLMPIKQGAGIYVAYRSYQDMNTDSPEFSFKIGRDPSLSGTGLDEFLSAHLREPDKESLFDQVLLMHQQNPQENVESIESKIKIRRIDMTEGECPAIRSQIKKLQKLHFNPPSFDMLVLHPLVHQFYMQSPAGNMDVALIDEKSDLVRWALETRHALELCSGGPTSLGSK